MPFSLSDILERIIPGAIFLGQIYIATYSLNLQISQALNNPALWFIFLAAAYAIGVVLNNSYNLWKISGSRDYWTVADGQLPAYKVAIKQAIKTHFQIEADEKSWAFCYGTCNKHGFSPNTQLFQGLAVFCRTMMMGMAFSTLIYAAAAVATAIADQTVPSTLLILTGGSMLLAFAFRSGAIAYDKAFVGSIYEGFYSWYCERDMAVPGSV